MDFRSEHRHSPSRCVSNVAVCQLQTNLVLSVSGCPLSSLPLTFNLDALVLILLSPLSFSFCKFPLSHPSLCNIFLFSIYSPHFNVCFLKSEMKSWVLKKQKKQKRGQRDGKVQECRSRQLGDAAM